MPIDMKQHHIDILRQMIGTPEIPDSVKAFYDDVKLAIDRASAGEMHPQTLALIAVLGSRADGVDISEPPEMVDDEEGPVMGNPNIDWIQVKAGAPVTCDWHGIKKGTFLNIAARGKVRIQLEDGPRVMRANRVRVEALEPIAAAE